MNLLAAYLIASLLSYVAAMLMAVWYLAPALARRPLAEALTVLAWVQAFRYVALQIFSASDVAGLQASLAAQRVIAFGDLATAVLAIVALLTLRRGMPVARPLMWVLAIVGTRRSGKRHRDRRRRTSGGHRERLVVVHPGLLRSRLVGGGGTDLLAVARTPARAAGSPEEVRPQRSRRGRARHVRLRENVSTSA